MSEGARTRSGDIEDRCPVLRITPEPTEEELAAIAAAVLALSRLPEAGDDDDTPSEDRWRSAGRRESLRSPLRR